MEKRNRLCDRCMECSNQIRTAFTYEEIAALLASCVAVLNTDKKHANLEMSLKSRLVSAFAKLSTTLDDDAMEAFIIDTAEQTGFRIEVVPCEKERKRVTHAAPGVVQ